MVDSVTARCMLLKLRHNDDKVPGFITIVMQDLKIMNPLLLLMFFYVVVCTLLDSLYMK